MSCNSLFLKLSYCFQVQQSNEFSICCTNYATQSPWNIQELPDNSYFCVSVLCCSCFKVGFDSLGSLREYGAICGYCQSQLLSVTVRWKIIHMCFSFEELSALEQNGEIENIKAYFFLEKKNEYTSINTGLQPFK